MIMATLPRMFLPQSIQKWFSGCVIERSRRVRETSEISLTPGGGSGIERFIWFQTYQKR